MSIAILKAGRPLWQLLLAAGVVVTAGCSQHGRLTQLPREPRVLVVAPVLNLSGGEDFDPLRLTDLVASELASFQGVSVVPVNLALAELEHSGRWTVETSDDAIRLAEAFDADATLVTAVTEYDPYAPPRIGLIMQWYDVRPVRVSSLNPVAASRTASDEWISLSDVSASGPRWQVQRVFNAADERTLEEVRLYAKQRNGDPSPYGWRKYTKSQELWARYATWALIRTMLSLDAAGAASRAPHEAK